MRVHTLSRQQTVPVTPAGAFAFFSNALNLEAITPPWLRFRVLAPAPIELRPGARIEYRLRLHGVPVRWLTEIRAWEPERCFVDVALRGPYRLWEHTHDFEPTPDGRGTVIRDVVRYALPLGPLGELAHSAFVRRDLERIFDFRHQAVAALLDPQEVGPSGSRRRQ